MSEASKAQRQPVRLRGRAISLAVVLVLVACHVALPQQRRQTEASQASGDVQFTSGHSALNIPFEFEDNAIVVRVAVNDSKPLKFFFDTGAGMSVVSTGHASMLGLHQADKVKATGTGGTVEGVLATGISLSLPGVKVLNQKVAVLSLDDFPCEAGDIAGFIGADFIKEFVVEIDYDAKLIHLFAPGTYKYSRNGEMFPLKIQRTPRVRAKIKMPGQEPIEGLFEIDTGSEGTLVVNSPFVNRHKLLETLNNRIPTKGEGIGGASQRVGARLETLQLGRFTIAAPVIELAIETNGALATTDNDGPIGNVILRRFRITLDYSRRRMWLEPNGHLTDEFEGDMSGIEFEATGQDCRVFKVTNVVERSPATDAGIQTGDEFLAIDGKPAKEFNSSQIYKLFMKEGAEHELMLKRADVTLKVRIKLRRLL